MSDNGASGPRRLMLMMLAAYLPVLGAALIVVDVIGGSALAAWITFICGGALVGAMTYLILAPRSRRLLEAARVADAFAAGRYGARAESSADDLGMLAASLNATGASIERVVSTLRDERAQLEALLNSSSDATVAVDAAGRVVYLNAAAREIFTQVGAEAMGRPFIQVVRDHDVNALLLAAAQRAQRSVRVVAYGQAERWLQATAVPIEGAGSWAALAVFHDLTEVRRLDSVRRDFISNVSHELRTPLAGIRAAAETLQEGALEDRSTAVEFLGHIQRETDRMTQLVEELLELSRIESGAAPLRFQPLDVRSLVEDGVRRFARQAERAEVRLSARSDGTPLIITADGERLDRALSNLIANAIKFTPSGGEITVSATSCDGGVAILVQDTGVGIQPDQQARIFERFYKIDRGRQAGGTGLGLAIVKHIVQAHDGSVSVESRPGHGSTFVVRLPHR